MIDTVGLVFEIGNPKTQTIISPKTFSQWSPNFESILSATYQKGMSTSFYVGNGKKKGVYQPRLTAWKQYVRGGFIRQLYIEFSAPKLLFGNNFDELQESDLPRLCYKLRKTLSDMGVTLSYDQVLNADVKTIHFGKNIVFTDGSIPAVPISHISRMAFSSRERTHVRDYKNGGEAFYIGTNNHQLCIYDKRKELENSKLSEVDNLEVDNWCQTGIFNQYKIQEPFQVLRIESRSKGHIAIAATLEKAGIKATVRLTLQDLFKIDVARSVLECELIKLTAKTPNVLFAGVDLINHVDELRKANPGAKMETILQAIAVSELQSHCGLSTAQRLLRCNNTKWSRQLKQIGTLKCKSPPADNLAEIRRQVKEFRPVKLENYVKK